MQNNPRKYCIHRDLLLFLIISSVFEPRVSLHVKMCRKTIKLYSQSQIKINHCLLLLSDKMSTEILCHNQNPELIAANRHNTPLPKIP